VAAVHGSSEARVINQQDAWNSAIAIPPLVAARGADTEEDGRSGIRAQWPGSGSDGAGVRGTVVELGSRGQLDGALPGGGGMMRQAADRSVVEQTSRRAFVLSGIWRREVTVLLIQQKEGEKLSTIDEWAPQEFPFSDLTNLDSGFWLRKNS
jgi:hypothetical protein